MSKNTMLILGIVVIAVSVIFVIMSQRNQSKPYLSKMDICMNYDTGVRGGGCADNAPGYCEVLVVGAKTSSNVQDGGYCGYRSVE
jgi:hypothetical protein